MVRSYRIVCIAHSHGEIQPHFQDFTDLCIISIRKLLEPGGGGGGGGDFRL